MNFSQKSPGFNLFDSSLFGAENSSDEVKNEHLELVNFQNAKYDKKTALTMNEVFQLDYLCSK